MRMKFLRILPETCARTWCLFSSSTRNMAFGSGSITVAMTSMASSFGFPESPFFLSSNCFAIVSCSALSFPYHDGPVSSFGLVRIHGPLAVIATVCSKCAEGLPSAVAVVRQVGLVVHLRSDAVLYKLPHHRKPVLLDPALHGVAHIAEAVARAHLVYRTVQRFAGHLQELLDFRPNLPDWNRDRRIRVVAVHFHPEIDGDDVAFSQLPLR